MKYYNRIGWQECSFKRPHYNILMIGNSFCYYFVEELVGIAFAAGIDLDIYNIYKSGCTIQEHYNSLKEEPSKNDYTDKDGNKIYFQYQIFRTNINGRVGIELDDINRYLQEILKKITPKLGWDIISLQEHFNPNSGQVTTIPKEKQVRELYNFLKQQYPKAKLYWHETWAYEIGHKSENKPINPSSKTQQQEQQKVIYERSVAAAAQGPAKLIPSGEAWAAARENPWLGQEMCIRSNVGNDYYHDGDLGGGQYLNACVWFETLFNRSCIGNSWRPTSYSLLEQKIHAAQQVAHNIIK